MLENNETCLPRKHPLENFEPILRPNRPAPNPPSLPAPSPTTASTVDVSTSSENEISTANMGSSTTSIPPSPFAPPPPSVKRALVLYDFLPEKPEDLALRAGDTVEVLESNGDWWRGRCNGSQGLFPSNYVQIQ